MSTDRQIHDGRSFVLDAPTVVPAIWGRGTDVLWAQGESLIITGPQGAGKSTVAEQLALARGGILEPELLGFPVATSDRPVFYLACDRPRQIARSFRRMVTDEHAEALKERLKVWAGPLPFDLTKEPHRLAMLAESLGVGTVFIDSLKDIAWPLSSDDLGAAVNRAIGGLIVAEIETVVIHHNRKATAENKKPKALSDVDGSVWITAGSGSVLSLWGEAGDPVIEVTHIKQPADDVGPLEIEHDHEHGRTRLRERVDAWTILQRASKEGVTAHDAATEIYGRNPSRADLEKVRRRLQRFVDDGFATPSKGSGATDPVVFRATSEKDACSTVYPHVYPTRQLHRPTRTPVNTAHASYTAPDRPPHPLREWGERVATVAGRTDPADPELQVK